MAIKSQNLILFCANSTAYNLLIYSRFSVTASIYVSHTHGTSAIIEMELSMKCICCVSVCLSLLWLNKQLILLSFSMCSIFYIFYFFSIVLFFILLYYFSIPYFLFSTFSILFIFILYCVFLCVSLCLPCLKSGRVKLCRPCARKLKTSLSTVASWPWRMPLKLCPMDPDGPRHMALRCLEHRAKQLRQAKSAVVAVQTISSKLML